MLMAKKFLFGTFQDKELLKTNQEKFRIEMVIKRTGNKWAGFDNSFNCLIGKKCSV